MALVSLLLGAATAFGALSATFNSAYDVGTTAISYSVSGELTLALNFSPTPGQQLLLVDNTGTGAISGTFTGLAEGATVTSSYGGNTFTFRISYVGGDGNDITLTRIGGTGQVTSSGSYYWSLLAGSAGGPGSLDASGAQASFFNPQGTAVDSAGNVYVADSSNHTIRKVTPAGEVTTLAGSAGLSGSTDGAGGAARFTAPRGVAVDSAGNIYVVDSGNHTIRKVTPGGVVSTLAGSAGSSGSSDGTGSIARFNSPRGVAVDNTDHIYVADLGSHTIRKVTPAGVVTTLAGTAGLSGSSDGTGSSARFNNPWGVALDGSGNVYVADTHNHTIRKVTFTGVVTTLAGSAGQIGTSDGAPVDARFAYPTDVGLDASGNVYVVDYSTGTIRKVTPDGGVTTLAGTAGQSGSNDGSGSAASFNGPTGIAVDLFGNVHVADSGNHTIRKVTPSGLVSTLVGTSLSSGSNDGSDRAARFSGPAGLVADSKGNVYVADFDNHTIRKVTPEGVVTTLAGSAGLKGSTDGTGSAARFNNPQGLAVDSEGNVFVADRSNHTIRKVTVAGVVTTLAGSAGSSGSADGTGGAARFYSPRALTADNAGNVYVADSWNHAIRKVTSDGVVSTLAGSAGESGGIDGAGSAARFNNPTGVAVDVSGNVYVADYTNHLIRKVTPAGVVTTVAGSAGNSGSSDGAGSFARFNNPMGVSVDESGNFYVADASNHTIRKVTSSGVVSTVGGLAGLVGHEVGYDKSARFYIPLGIAVSPSGRLYAADQNHRVAQGEMAGFQPILTLGSVTGIGTSGATISGTVNPNGFVSTASFEYGITPAYGSSASVTLSPSGGTTAQNVSAALSGLSAGTLYYYRLTATNVDGTASTNGGTFTTVSTNADLSGLTLSSGTLNPGFASAATNYTASVANGTTSITVTPTPVQPNAILAVRVNGGVYSSVTPGSPSGVLALNVGSNTVDVRVTAQDAIIQKIYTVIVTRMASTLNPSINGGSDVPVTSAGFVATGSSLGTVSLGFSPIPQQVLVLVNNTGSTAISGAFTGLAEGATVTSSYGGNTFTFRISYVGGDGNDITLTRVGSTDQITSSNTYLWSPLAGSLLGAENSFFNPQSTAVDDAGNIFVADRDNNTIRKINSSGVVSTLAGTAGLAGSANGTGSAARFNAPRGVAVDGAGNVFVADTGNHSIRKVTPAGVVTTVAGSAGYVGGADGTGSAARFSSPGGVTVDYLGNIYVADTGNHTIRMVTPAGVVTTLAGSAGMQGSANGTGNAARFNFPMGVSVDNSRTVYVADTYNQTIRTINPDGLVITFAGSAGMTGNVDGFGIAARFAYPTGVAVDASGNVFVADFSNHTIRKVDFSGMVTTLAGAPNVSGSGDGTGEFARFNTPVGVSVSSSGEVYVADQTNHLIRRVTSGGLVTTLAGNPNLKGTADGAASAARFWGPTGVTADSSGNVYVADYFNHTIRKVTPAGMVSTLAGSAGNSGNSDGTGSAARFSFPSGVAVDNTGNVYVADFGNQTIRKVSSAGVVTTFAGSAGNTGSSDGTGGSARFNYPRGIAVDGSGNVYVADQSNHTIRKVTSAGVVSTLAGFAGSSGSLDAAGSAARFRSPNSVAVDNSGNVYVADQSNHTIRKVTPAGVVSTLAGSPGDSGNSDGLGVEARFYYPHGAAVDSTGNVYVADRYNHTIRKVSPAGIVTTVGGLAGWAGNAFGYGSASRFYNPLGIAVSPAGRLYAADENHRVIQGEMAGFQPILTQGSATGIGINGATLSGTVNPNGFVTTASFEYGITPAYGSSASVTLSPSSGTTAQNVSAALSGLSAGTLYYYRLTATNVDGTASTNGGTFTTVSTNADLSGLALSSGTLNPGFASATTSYAASVVNTIASITVTPTSSQANATLAVRVNSGTYAAVASGSPSAALALNVGANTINVRVTAQDGASQKTYTVVVTRLEPILNPSFNGGSDIPVTSAGFVATGNSFGTMSLGFQPGPQQVLLLVNNTGSGAISGTFTGLAEGATVTASHGGNTFAFRISYVGGTGNDITLTRIGLPGQVSSGGAYLWSLLAGSVGGPGSLDATGAQASFLSPEGTAVDSAGNVYVADRSNHTIRKVTPAGVVTTMAGSAGLSGSADGTGSAARFSSPTDVDVDNAGNVYVADSVNQTIRKVTPAGVVTTLAGTAGSTGSTDGTGSAASFRYPEGVAVDNAGNVHVADSYNHTIRKLTPAGVVTTLAGTAGSSGSTDGTGSAARFSSPGGVAVDSAGNVYVADRSNHTIRKVTPAGLVTTLAGGAGSIGAIDGTGNAARFNKPSSVAMDNAGNVYVADSDNQTIRKVTPAGVVTTMAGTAGSSGSIDGTGSIARFNSPRGVAVDNAGNVYVGDNLNCTIRKLTSAGVVTTLAGAAWISGNSDGAGSVARFSYPVGAAVDVSGNVYVADKNNNSIRKVTSVGVVSTLAGSAAGAGGSADGTGSAARFWQPTGVAADSSGNVYVSDSNNHTIRKITPAGVVTTLAGSAGISGASDGTGSAARFFQPSGVAVDGAGNIYVSDGSNHTIRKITSTGMVTTLAGSAGITGGGDGVGSSARFNHPSGIAVDNTGNIYVADISNHAIRKVTSAGVVTTLAGLAGSRESNDGTGSAARFYYPWGVSVDSAGNLYVGDQSNHTIRKVTSAGVVTSLGGLASVVGHDSGYGSVARFYYPQGIAMSASGRIYVTDDNHRVAQGQFMAGYQPILTLGSVTGIGLSGATLSGTVNPNGFVSTASFEYGTTTAYGSSASVTLSPTNNTAAQNVSAVLAGLSPGTLYYYRLTAANADGATTSEGTFTTVSTNADLGGLTLSRGTLSPAFSSATPYYTASVGNGTDSITIMPTAAQVNATVEVRVNEGAYASVSSGSASGSMALSMGSNTIDVRVTAQDGVTRKTYTMIVTRLAATLNPIFNGSADVPVASAGFVATGTSLGTVGLGFAPGPDQALVLVNNTGAGSISGTFTGLAEGAAVTANYGGDTFTFRISYAGGDGNDIILTRIGATGQIISTSFRWDHLAGSMDGYSGSSDGVGGAARFNNPRGLAVDSSGNVYVADGSNHTIRKVTPAGAVTTLVGSAGIRGGIDGAGNSARFNSPSGVAVDGSGNACVADGGNHTIRKVTTGGVVTTLAGSAGLMGSSDGTGAAARFYYPNGVAVDGSGNVYVADQNNNTIRKVTSAGVVTTLAGAAGSSGSADGTGSAARFNNIRGLAVDGTGNIYVADSWNNTIRKVTAAGVVTTLAGGAGLTGSSDGTGGAARFNGPTGMAVDVSGNVYVTDLGNATIRKVTSAGVVSTIGGLAGVSGRAAGYGSGSRFYNPVGIAVSASGRLFVTDQSHRVVKGALTGFPPILTLGSASGLGVGGATLNGTVNPNGFVTTATFEYGTTLSYGSSSIVTLGASNNTTAQNASAVLTGLSSGTLYYYRLTATNVDGTTTTSTGTFSTISTNADLAGLALSSGTLSPAFASATADYSATVANGTPSIAITSTLGQANATLAVRVNGSAYAAVTSGSASGFLPLNVGNNTVDVRVTAQDGVTQKIYTVIVTRMAATLSPIVNGGSDVPVTSAGFVAAGTSLGTMSLGFSPSPRQELVLVNNTGAGSISGTFTGLAEGAAVTASYGGNTFTFRISYVGGDGNDITLTRGGAAGQVISSGTYLWIARAGSSGSGVAVDGSGNVYLSDQYQNTIRKVTAAGVVTTLAGSAGSSGSIDGTGTAAQFNHPSGVAVDGSGNVYVADQYNNTIRKVTPTGVVTTLAGTAGSSGSIDGTGSAARFSSPGGLAVDGSGNVYVADQNNYTIRKVSPSGVVVTLAGRALSGSSDGTGSAARFNYPTGVAVDGSGNIYVADYGNNTIRKVTSAGVVTTLAGSAGSRGSSDGTGSSARFSSPIGIAVDSSGNVYVADYGNHTIRKVTSAGVVTTIGGLAGVSGLRAGFDSSARFSNPEGIAISSAGRIYVTDGKQGEVAGFQPILTQGAVSGTSLAGATLNGTVNPNGFVTSASFEYGPTPAYGSSASVTLSSSNNTTAQNVSAVLSGLSAGTLYYYRLTATNVDGTATTSGGTFSTISTNADLIGLTPSGGILSPGFAGATTSYTASVGNAISSITLTATRAQQNATLAVRVNGGTYATVTSGSPSGPLALNVGSNIIDVRVIAQDGLTQKVYTVNVTRLGVGLVPVWNPGFNSGSDVPAIASSFVPTGNSLGTVSLGFAPSPEQVLLLVNNTGAGPIGGTFNGLAEGATITAGYVGNTFTFRISYVGGDGNDVTLTRIGATGQIANGNYRWSDLAGSRDGYGGSIDGAGSAARFNYPNKIAIDGSGNIYVADSWNHTIRKVTPAGVVTTLAGSANNSGNSDGSGNAARFYNPIGVGVDGVGNVYVADQINHTIRKVTSAGVVTTLAGYPGYGGSSDGTGTAARFYYPNGVAVDGSGNLYVADGYHTIRKVTSAGVVTTIAGFFGSSGSIDGTGSAARFNSPDGVAVDGSGNVYVADKYNSAIRKVTSAGEVTTLAGYRYFGGVGSIDGTGSAARFSGPQDVAVDNSGNVYVADTENHTIRKVTPAGEVTTIGGLAGVADQQAGIGSLARFYRPNGIAVSAAGRIFVADRNNRVAQGEMVSFQPILTQGIVSGIGISGATLNGTVNPNGFVTSASFEYGPTPAYGSSASVTLSSSNNTTAQNVSAVLSGLSAGTLYYYRLTATNVDGTATTSGGTFSTISTNADLIGLTPSGGILSPGFAGATTSYTASVGNAISSITLTATRAQQNATLAVRVNGGTYATVTSGSPSGPLALNVGSNIIDVRVIAQDGLTQKVYTVNVTRLGVGLVPVWNPGFNSGSDVPAIASSFVPTGNSLGTVSLGFAPSPEQVLLLVNNTGAGPIGGTFNGLAEGATITAGYVGNTFTFRISYVGGDGNDVTLSRIGATGQIANGNYRWSDLAGGFSIGSANGTGSAALFYYPASVAVDDSGNVYVADSYNHAIRKVSSAGVVTTLAGYADYYYGQGSTDGYASYARFNQPNGVALDGARNLYVADTANHTIRKVTTDGVVITLAGSAYSIGSNDGTGAAARFYYPNGVAVDGSGNVYVADGCHTIRKVTSAGVVTTIAGFFGNSGSTDGAGSDARFNNLRGLAVDSMGNIYVADSWNHTIRKVTPAGLVSTLAGSAGVSGSSDGTGGGARFKYPRGVAVDGFGNIYVADYGNHTIRKVTSAGVVTTIGGLAGQGGRQPGIGSVARFISPTGIAVSATGELYVADENHRVAKADIAGFQPILTQGGVSELGGDRATLNGTVNPNGFVTAASFEYGLTTAYGSSANVSLNPSDGTSAQNVHASLAGLSPSTTYCYRLTATNVDGTQITNGGTFTTTALSTNADLSALSISNGTLSPIFASATTSYAASVGHASDSISVAPASAQADATIEVRVNAGTFAAVSSGGLSENLPLNVGSNTIDVRVTAQDGVTQKTYTVEVIRLAPPTVTDPCSTAITATGAILGGSVTNDGGDAPSECGVVYSVTETNDNPLIGGIGVSKVVATGGAGAFAVQVTGLETGTGYAFKAYATNSQGTTYSSLGMFTTLSTNADLSDLALSGGMLNPAFASATTNYTASVANATTSITVTPTRAQSEASIAVRVNGGVYSAVSSGSPSGDLPLNVGSNTIEVQVTAQDGVTQNVYNLEVTVLSGLASWRQQYFGSEENSGNGADLATPDGDGIPNLVKYALLMTPGQNGASQLPQAAMTGPAGNRCLTLSFERDPTRNDVTLIVEAQSSLGGDWSEIARSTNGADFTGPAPVSETSTANGTKAVTVQDVVGNAFRRFMRVRVER